MSERPTSKNESDQAMRDDSTLIEDSANAIALAQQHGIYECCRQLVEFEVTVQSGWKLIRSYFGELSFSQFREIYDSIAKEQHERE